MSYHDGAIKLREDAISDPEGAEKYKYIELSHPIHDDEHGYPYVEVGVYYMDRSGRDEVLLGYLAGSGY